MRINVGASSIRNSKLLIPARLTRESTGMCMLNTPRSQRKTGLSVSPSKMCPMTHREFTCCPLCGSATRGDLAFKESLRMIFHRFAKLDMVWHPCLTTTWVAILLRRERQRWRAKRSPQTFGSPTTRRTPKTSTTLPMHLISSRMASTGGLLREKTNVQTRKIGVQNVRHIIIWKFLVRERRLFFFASRRTRATPTTMKESSIPHQSIRFFLQGRRKLITFTSGTHPMGSLATSSSFSARLTLDCCGRSKRTSTMFLLGSREIPEASLLRKATRKGATTSGLT
mmetsp:Transcript_7630/g.15484  ORF Transcript_7630/g.15484 Transcript_7630/m.15484 type:complete len:283 (-) Transcript_7630:3160-4008(-)